MKVTSIERISGISPPPLLREKPGWLMWRYEDELHGSKPRKMPYYSNGRRRTGKQGSPDDLRSLTSFERARAAAARMGFDGVGFATLAEFGILALDFDHCVQGEHIHPDVLACCTDTYAELSPSGMGVRVFLQGNLGNRKSHGGDYGMELFSTRGYVTFTGNVLPEVQLAGLEESVAPVNETVARLVFSRFSQAPLVQDSAPVDPVGLTQQQISDALAALDPSMHHDQWLQVGMALHHELGGDGFALWDDWSAQGVQYPGRDELEKRWDSFGRADGRPVTARTLIRMANQAGARINLNQAATAEEFDDAVIGNAGSTPAPVADRSGGGPAVRFSPVPLAQFADRPAPGWLIKGLLPRAGLAVLYGQPGAGKSFIALDMAAALCRGLPWRDRRTRQGRVVYVAAEGAGGFRTRCLAYLQSQGLALNELPLEIIADCPNLLARQDALDLTRALGKCDVVILDTFAQVTPGGNENSGEDMGLALSHCRGIHQATGALVLLVHHSGKDQSKGARGWSGIKGAADAELEVIREGEARMLRVSKQKDGEDGLKFGFGLEIVTLGLDEDGDPITSCVVVEQGLPTVGAINRPLGTVEILVNQVIQEFALGQLAGIEVNEVIKLAVDRLPGPEDGKRDTRRARAARAVKTLCEGPDAPYLLEDDATLTVV